MSDEAEKKEGEQQVPEKKKTAELSDQDLELVSGGAGQGKVTQHDFTITKLVDKA